MNLPGLTLTNNDLGIEYQQMLDEGRDMSPAIEEEFSKLKALNLEADPSAQTRVQALLDMAAGLPFRADYAYREPSDLEGIRKERPNGPSQQYLLWGQLLSHESRAQKNTGANHIGDYHPHPGE